MIVKNLIVSSSGEIMPKEIHGKILKFSPNHHHISKYVNSQELFINSEP